MVEPKKNFFTSPSPALSAVNITQISRAALTLGQKTAANSIPVVLPSDANGANQASALFTQPRKLATFSAFYRLAARPYALSNAFGAAGRKQYATIFHAAGATKTVKLRRVLVAVKSASVAAIIDTDLIRLTAATTPATGNPAITPTPANAADTVEATCLALPTTAGTESGLYNSQEWNLGVTAAGTVVNPPPPTAFVDLLSFIGRDQEMKHPTMRAGVAEGWAVTFDCSAAATILGYVMIEFTEE